MASCAAEHAPRLLYEAVVEELREYLEASSPALREATAERAKRRSSVTGLATLWIFFARLPANPGARRVTS